MLDEVRERGIAVGVEAIFLTVRTAYRSTWIFPLGKIEPIPERAQA